MSTISKPSSGAFVLKADKTDEFINKRNANAQKTLERFFSHQPKKGVKTPYKGGND